MNVTTRQRFESGDICLEGGCYEFDGYVSGPPDPLPLEPEWEIPLSIGDIFPPIQSRKRACYWKLATVSAARPLVGGRQYVTAYDLGFENGSL